jgi:hypothetical protein
MQNNKKLLFEKQTQHKLFLQIKSGESEISLGVRMVATVWVDFL